jgi:hypothetical protein
LKSLTPILFFQVLELLQQLLAYLRPFVLLPFFFFSLQPLFSLQERYAIFLSLLKDPLAVFFLGLTLALLLHLLPLLPVLNLLSSPSFSLFFKAHVPFQDVKGLSRGRTGLLLTLIASENPFLWLSAGSPLLRLTAKNALLWLSAASPLLWLAAENPLLWLADENPLLWLAAASPLLWLAAETPLLWLAAENPLLWLAATSPLLWLAAETPLLWLAAASPLLWLAAENPLLWLAAENPLLWLTAASPLLWLAAASPLLWLAAENPLLWLTSKKPLLLLAAASLLLSPGNFRGLSFHDSRPPGVEQGLNSHCHLSLRCQVLRLRLFRMNTRPDDLPIVQICLLDDSVAA